MDEAYIPFHRPSIGDAEVDLVVEVLRSGWLTTGPLTARFEREFCARAGAGHAIAVNSATAGLHLALVALGVGPGDEVITTPLTFCATVNAVLHTGATPVLADVDETLNIDPDRVAAVLSDRTRVLLPVHFAGLPCDMPRLWRIAADRRLAVVEDAAHAAGAAVNGVPIGGGSSDAVAFSFYATKNMTTGEGGMVTTPSGELARRIRSLCLHGMSRDAWDRYSTTGSWHYDVVECGFKYNLSDLASAIGLCQLAKLDAMTERRRDIARAYTEAFFEVPELETPPEGGGGHCWHLYVLRLNLSLLDIDRGTFIDQMRARGVGCSVHFIPIPLHSYYRTVLPKRDTCCRALSEYPRLVSLPLYPALTGAAVQQVIRAVLGVVAHGRKRKRAAVGRNREVPA